jgi:hypothetical protein
MIEDFYQTAHFVYVSFFRKISSGRKLCGEIIEFCSRTRQSTQRRRQKMETLLVQIVFFVDKNKGFELVCRSQTTKGKLIAF